MSERGKYGEPWSEGVSGSSFVVSFDGMDVRPIGYIANARQRGRAIACVNALDGMDPAAVAEVLTMADVLLREDERPASRTTTVGQIHAMTGLRAALARLRGES